MNSDYKMGKDVVMVHGIFNTGRVFWRMRRYFESKGLRCHTIDLKPNWGGAEIEVLSAQLRDFITERTERGSDITLIGNSMGALVSRYYIQELGGIHIVSRFMSIAGPHHGTLCAYFWIGKGTKQMRFNSPFLKRLEEGENQLKGFPITSYRTRWENVIIPSSSSHWDIADNKVVPVISHQYMPFSMHVARDIFRRIEMGDVSVEA